uniref:Uncharacterized protein n=1 Tax=Anguilla anguilla TaxID=7936 RepID=A0A0E9UXM7_ANGAN
MFNLNPESFFCTLSNYKLCFLSPEFIIPKINM